MIKRKSQTIQMSLCWLNAVEQDAFAFHVTYCKKSVYVLRSYRYIVIEPMSTKIDAYSNCLHLIKDENCWQHSGDYEPQPDQCKILYSICIWQSTQLYKWEPSSTGDWPAIYLVYCPEGNNSHLPNISETGEWYALALGTTWLRRGFNHLFITVTLNTVDYSSVSNYLPNYW